MAAPVLAALARGRLFRFLGGLRRDRRRRDWLRCPTRRRLERRCGSFSARPEATHGATRAAVHRDSHYRWRAGTSRLLGAAQATRAPISMPMAVTSKAGSHAVTGGPRGNRRHDPRRTWRPAHAKPSSTSRSVPPRADADLPSANGRLRPAPPGCDNRGEEALAAACRLPPRARPVGSRRLRKDPLRQGVVLPASVPARSAIQAR